MPILMWNLASAQRISLATSQVPNISSLVISNILCWRLTHQVCSSILESLTVRMLIRGCPRHLSPHTRLLAGLHACEINQWVRCWRRLPTISTNSMADFGEPTFLCLCYTINPYVCRCCGYIVSCLLVLFMHKACCCRQYSDVYCIVVYKCIICGRCRDILVSLLCLCFMYAVYYMWPMPQYTCMICLLYVPLSPWLHCVLGEWLCT